MPDPTTPAPHQQTVMMPPAQAVPDGPTSVSAWARFIQTVPSEKLLVSTVIVIAGFLVYTDRTDRQLNTMNAIRVQQEENERNRQANLERDARFQEWNRNENERNRTITDQQLKMTISSTQGLNTEVGRLAATCLRLELLLDSIRRNAKPSGPNGHDPSDPCELRPWWDRIRHDGTAGDEHGRTPVGRLDGADDHNGPRVVGRLARQDGEHNLGRSAVAHGAELNLARADVVAAGRQVDADAVADVVRGAAE